MLIKKQICMTAYRQLTKSLLLQDLGLGADCFISLVIGHSSLLSLWQENDIRENGQMITSIVFDVDDTIYDQQAPYRIAMENVSLTLI